MALYFRRARVLRVKWFTRCGYGHCGYPLSLCTSSRGGPRRCFTNRRASHPTQSPHRPFEAINATHARHPTHTMLVKQICQQVILIIYQVHRAARRYASSHSMFCSTTIAAAAASRTTSDDTSLSAATMVCFNAVVPLRRLLRESTARTWRVQ